MISLLAFVTDNTQRFVTFYKIGKPVTSDKGTHVNLVRITQGMVSVDVKDLRKTNSKYKVLVPLPDFAEFVPLTLPP